MSIQRRGGLVENQYRSILQKCSRNREALLFASGQRRTSLADDGVVTFRQAADETVGICCHGSRHYFLARSVGSTIGNVVCHCHRKDERLLQNQRDLLAQRTRCHLAYVLPIDAYRSGSRIEE